MLACSLKCYHRPGDHIPLTLISRPLSRPPPLMCALPSAPRSPPLMCVVPAPSAPQVRVVAAPLETQKKQVELDDGKSKAGLGELYEQDYVRQVGWDWVGGWDWAGGWLEGAAPPQLGGGEARGVAFCSGGNGGRWCSGLPPRSTLAPRRCLTTPHPPTTRPGPCLFTSVE